MTIYKCDKCQYETDRLDNFKRHAKTRQHGELDVHPENVSQDDFDSRNQVLTDSSEDEQSSTKSNNYVDLEYSSSETESIFRAPESKLKPKRRRIVHGPKMEYPTLPMTNTILNIFLDKIRQAEGGLTVLTLAELNTTLEEWLSACLGVQAKKLQSSNRVYGEREVTKLSDLALHGIAVWIRLSVAGLIRMNSKIFRDFLNIVVPDITEESDEEIMDEDEPDSDQDPEFVHTHDTDI
jgi:hypothetical protein